MSITVKIETTSVETNHTGAEKTTKTTKTTETTETTITNVTDLKQEIKNTQKENGKIFIKNPSTGKSIRIRDKEQNVILNNISTEEELNVYLNVLEKETEKRIAGYQK